MCYCRVCRCSFRFCLAPSATVGAITEFVGVLSAIARAITDCAGVPSESAGVLSATAGAIIESSGVSSATAGVPSGSAGIIVELEQDAPVDEPKPTTVVDL